jgi:hypothetical protein
MKLKEGDQCLYVFNSLRGIIGWVQCAVEVNIEAPSYEYYGDETDYPTKISALRSEILQELCRET